MSLLVQIPSSAPAVDSEALRHELEGRIEGEVRFDPVSRALYSTDFEVSKAIAGQRLLPAVQAMKAGEVLVAPGTSFRHQLSDLAGTVAVHPAVLIRDLLM